MQSAVINDGDKRSNARLEPLAAGRGDRNGAVGSEHHLGGSERHGGQRCFAVPRLLGEGGRGAAAPLISGTAAGRGARQEAISHGFVLASR